MAQGEYFPFAAEHDFLVGQQPGEPHRVEMNALVLSTSHMAHFFMAHVACLETLPASCHQFCCPQGSPGRCIEFPIVMEFYNLGMVIIF